MLGQGGLLFLPDWLAGLENRVAIMVIVGEGDKLCSLFMNDSCSTSFSWSSSKVIMVSRTWIAAEISLNSGLHPFNVWRTMSSLPGGSPTSVKSQFLWFEKDNQLL